MPQLAYVRNETDRKKAEAEEHTAQEIGLTGPGLGRLDDFRFIGSGQENKSKGNDEAND